jgi:hypothetical protein
LFFVIFLSGTLVHTKAFFIAWMHCLFVSHVKPTRRFSKVLLKIIFSVSVPCILSPQHRVYNFYTLDVYMYQHYIFLLTPLSRSFQTSNRFKSVRTFMYLG